MEREAVMRRALSKAERAVLGYSSVAERHERAPQLVRASDLARELGVTPGQIWTWKSRRSTNGFPLPTACTWTPWRDARFEGKDLYDLDEVLLWFKEYDPRRNQARGGGRNPDGRRGKREAGKDG